MLQRTPLAWAAMVALCLTLARPAEAAPTAADAKGEFDAGRAAYDAHDYETAATHFRASYALSKQPALLFDLAGSLDLAGHPGAAAAALRAYLRSGVDEHEHRSLEQEVARLEAAQRRIDDARLTAPALPPALRPRRRQRRPLWRCAWMIVRCARATGWPSRSA